MQDGALRRLASRLERGAGAPAWEPLSRLWPRLVRLARPLLIPSGVQVLCVGGATLGGSGKTPLAIACAAQLLARGVNAAYVGHGYRAAVRRARFVSPDDDVRSVGDEALEAACRLGEGRVVVGPTRQATVDFASARADVLVLDGPLQLAPVRAHLSLLAVDREAPLGSGVCPPRGDLRAPWPALRAHADLVVSVGDRLAPFDRGPDGSALEAPIDARTVQLGAATHSIDALRGLRVGLATATARPDRFLRLLARRGIVPVETVHLPDHRELSLGRGSSLDCWVIPGKCGATLRARPDVATLDYHIALPADLERTLERSFPSAVPDACGTVVPFSAPTHARGPIFQGHVRRESSSKS